MGPVDTTIEDLGFFVQPKKSFGNFTLTTGIRVDLVNADADGVGATDRNIVEPGAFTPQNHPWQQGQVGVVHGSLSALGSLEHIFITTGKT